MEGVLEQTEGIQDTEEPTEEQSSVEMAILLEPGQEYPVRIGTADEYAWWHF